MKLDFQNESLNHPIHLIRCLHLQDNATCAFRSTLSLRNFASVRTNNDFSSCSCESTHQLIQRYIRCSPFNLCYTGLARFHLGTKFLLRHFNRLALQANCPSKRYASIQKLSFFNAHLEEIRSIANFPACCLNRLTLFCIHQITFCFGLLLLLAAFTASS
ncbi:hypothetical protein VN12_08205 [Pirellula sp. SH-Sr6A]|nr:hypothetical protein VN12_08205 [Pirellula sp. SH-Sr6A]